MYINLRQHLTILACDGDNLRKFWFSREISYSIFQIRVYIVIDSEQLQNITISKIILAPEQSHAG